MKFKPVLIAMIILTTMSCSNQKNPEKWSDEEVNNWFQKHEWLEGWNVQPDASINKRSLAINYFKNPVHWKQAFQFLKTANLNALPLGKQYLEGDHLNISVAEYIPKPKKETRYESHKKYIDIQYVIRGEELMGMTTLDKAEVVEPYNEENDIAFYDYDGGNYIKATPANFLVFFPEDAHRPSITTGDTTMVKKIVVKVLIE